MDPMILMLISILVIAVIVAWLANMAARPAHFHLERSAVIKAPPAKVFGLIDDFHEWAKWSPWEAMEADGDLKKTFSGSERGVGAHYGWEGPKTGVGHMDITHVEAGSQITIKLVFVKPWKATNTVDFALTPESGGTKVVWAMHGTRGFVHKLMGSVFNMDKMVGSQFEDGLSRMKKAAEG